MFTSAESIVCSWAASVLLLAYNPSFCGVGDGEEVINPGLCPLELWGFLNTGGTATKPAALSTLGRAVRSLFKILAVLKGSHI